MMTASRVPDDTCSRASNLLEGLPLKARILNLLFLCSTFFFGLILIPTVASAQFADEEAYEAEQMNYSWDGWMPFQSSLSPRRDIRLLNWNLSNANPPAPIEDYNRQRHFGGWLSFRDDQSCLDVRNRVLVRDSHERVQLKESNPCKIQSGLWHDPYSGEYFENPQKVDIDHMVPLKDAYINGAWKWTSQQRCLYANYMGFRDHLKAVSKYQNVVKSDKDPSRYIPPHEQYRCEYLKKWLTIKLIWKLSLHVEEARSIQQRVQREGCDPKDFVLTTNELNEQRRKIQELLPICAFRSSQDFIDFN